MDEPNPPSAKPATPPARPAPPRENLWANLGFNIFVPVVLMSARAQKLLGLAPLPALLVALIFPLGYGIYDLWRRRVWNIFSLIGLAGLLMTGGIGLLKLPAEWVAVKDASIPLALGIIVLWSLSWKRPLAQMLLLNPSVVDVARLEAALAARQTQNVFRKLLRRATAMVAASFLLSATLNYFLARHIVKSPAGTPEFTAEIGRMTALSWPVIALPSGVIFVAAMFYLLNGLKQATGLEMDDMFHADLVEEKPKKS